MSEFRPCMLIPTYDNPATIAAVVQAVGQVLPEILVVDDGSAAAGREACAALAAEGLAHVVHRSKNGGKGAAVKTGFQAAFDLGYTHAFQVDADGQHDLTDLPRFLEVSRAHPEALVLGAPIFDESAPKARQIGRLISVFWVNVETAGAVIEDPMCGFRIYPLADAVAIECSSDMMDFDPEVAVRLVWRGVPVINLPTRVRYVSEEEGGISHFHVFKDNVLISLMHARLCIERLFGGLFLRRRYHKNLLPAPEGARLPRES